MGDPRRPLAVHVGEDDRLPVRGAAAPQPDRRPRCRVGRCSNGIADIDRIPPTVLKAFSTRRAEIEERMAIRGQHSPKAAMIAALDTRRRKEIDPGRTQLRARWRERADDIGFDPARLDDASDVSDRTDRRTPSGRAIEDRLLGAGRADRARLVVRPQRHPAGVVRRAPRRRADRTASRTSPSGSSIGWRPRPCTTSSPAGARRSVTRPDGRSRRCRRRSVGRRSSCSTIERRALDTAHSLLGAERAVCGERAVLAALRAITDVCRTNRRGSDPDGHSRATASTCSPHQRGAGKTFAFAAARDAWERAGYRVIGAAHTGVAADELAMAAGIPSTTIARLLIAIDRGEPGGLDERTVLVVDEAGTAGTRDLARLLAEVDAHRRQGRAGRRPETAPRDRRRRPVRRADRAAAGDRAEGQPAPAARVGDRSAPPAPRRRHHPRPRTPTSTTAASPSATTPTTPRPSCSATGGRRSCAATTP